jgi:hypothetical protein
MSFILVEKVASTDLFIEYLRVLFLYLFYAQWTLSCADPGKAQRDHRLACSHWPYSSTSVCTLSCLLHIIFSAISHSYNHTTNVFALDSARINAPDTLRSLYGMTDTRNSFHGSGADQIDSFSTTDRRHDCAMH